jgi:16S rRNA (adenine1518-N6/adenine1519-N6)-dimethyltransferase
MTTTRPSPSPRKRFGQHFLHSPAAIQRIIGAVAPHPGQHLVEIGPGRGAITKPLLESGANLDVIELDRDLIPGLERLSANHGGRARIHQADALEIDLCSLAPGGKVRIVGNLPYNISTPLIFHFLDQRHCIIDMHLMLQKEVVDRMVAAPGSRIYGRLSVMVQFSCTVERLFGVGPAAFAPPPKVQSAFVRLVPRSAPEVAVMDPEMFALVVRQAFAQRRKTLRNSLRDLLGPDGFGAAGVDPGLRAEQLSLDDFARLSNAVRSESRGQTP